MIDQDKMRALAAKLRERDEFNSMHGDPILLDAADAIDLLLAEVEAIENSSTACCDSYAVENQRLSNEIDKLRADLEAAAADKLDAERWRAVRDTLSGAVGAGIEVNDERLVYQEPVPGEEVRIFWYPHTPVGFCEVHGSTLDGAADELIAECGRSASRAHRPS